jgi:hypothetical protein
MATWPAEPLWPRGSQQGSTQTLRNQASWNRLSRTEQSVWLNFSDCQTCVSPIQVSDPWRTSEWHWPGFWEGRESLWFARFHPGTSKKAPGGVQSLLWEPGEGGSGLERPGLEQVE